MNPNVKELQQALLGLGYEPGVIDGEYGPATHRAAMKAIHGELGGNGLTATLGKRLSEKGLRLIETFEGNRLTAYPDPGSGGDPWTIGVGHTGPEVHRGLMITPEQSRAYLKADVKRFEEAVSRLAPVSTQGQFDAMVSLAFNIGDGNLKTSTLLKKHNAGDHAGAKLEFAKWNKAAGRVMNGLTRRRAAEADLYGEIS